VRIGARRVNNASTFFSRRGALSTTSFVHDRRVFDEAAPALAVLLTMGVAAALVVVRGEVDNSVTALVLAAVVSGCGLLGGWRAGVAAAVTAAVSFNFFHTQPYLSLRIHDADDVLTTFVLLVVGLMGGVAGHVVARRGRVATEAGAEFGAVERILRLLNSGADAEDIEVAVRAELLDVLLLTDCRFVLQQPPDVATLGRAGAIEDALVVYHDGGFELPARGVAIPVSTRGSTRGYLVCAPTPGVAVSLLRRRAAVCLAGLLALALAGADQAAGPSRN